MTPDILDQLDAALAAELAAPRCADGLAITRRRAVLRDAASAIRALRMELAAGRIQATRADAEISRLAGGRP